MFAKREPLKALAMLVLLFSLAGVPPMLGFFGKFYVLKAAVDAGHGLAGGGGRGRLGDRGVLLPAHRLLHVFRRASGAGGRAGWPPVQWAMLVASAAIMVVGVVNLFGIEAWPPPAAASACPLRPAGPRAYGRIVLDEVDSTNAEAAAPAPRPRDGPTWIMAHRADRRRAGGARGPGRSRAGNFAATLVLQPGGPADTAALRSFVAALALRDAGRADGPAATPSR